MTAFSETPSEQRPTSARSNGYSFRSDATPQEKKEETLKAMPAGLKTSKRNRGHEITGDLSAKPKLDMPAPSSLDSVTKNKDTLAHTVGKQEDAKIGCKVSRCFLIAEADQTGEMAGGSSRAEYAQMIKNEESERSLDGKTPALSNLESFSIEDYLPQSAFGEWYHNAGIIIFCALTCWIVGRLGGGLTWIIVVGSICATYYRTSIHRVRRNARDDITRQLAKAKLETDTESAEWMNSFLTKFWIIYEPVLSATIVASVDQVLSSSTPASIESMRLSFFTLGTKPPRIEHVKTYPKSEDDIVLMDWRFSFTPNDTEDLTARQLKNKINPKIELAIRAGVSIAAVSIPIVVEDIAFSGLMQVRIKLMTEFPHIKIVDLSFLEKPEIAYVLKPIGGSSLGFDIGFVPDLSGWILEMIHATMAPMMYAPNVFSLNIQQMLSGAPIDSAIGVAVVTVHSCHGLRNPDLGSGTPDPYVTLNVAHGEVARTRIIKSQTDPRFDEVKTLLLTTLTDSLSFEVLDYNEVRKDKVLGMASFDLTRLQQEPVVEHLSESIMSNGKTRGNVNYSISWYPVLTASKLEDGTMGPEPVTKSGIVRFTVHQAKNLGGGKNCNPYAILTSDSHELTRTPKVKHTNNPVWDFSKEILVTDLDQCTLGVQLKTEDFGADTLLGAYSIRLKDLLHDTKEELDDFTLKNSRESTAKVKLSATWKPISMDEPLAGKYVSPIGVLRLQFLNATGLRNPESGITGGKADPYMRVMVNGQRRAQTITIKNEQNPEWNEIVYVPIKHYREKVVLEAMDYQSHTKDRSLGQIALDLSSFIREDVSGLYLSHHEEQPRQEIFVGKDAKGALVFKVSFYPAMNVFTPEEEENSKLSNAENAPVVATSQSPATLLSDEDSTEQTTNAQHQRTLSSLTNHSVATSKGKEYRASQKVHLTKDDILRYNSGFLVFELVEGQVSESNTCLQVLFDDYLYPAFSTQKSQSRHIRWNETGEGFVRELDASRITLRIAKEVDSLEDDHIIATAQDDTLSVLRRSFNENTTQNLKSKDGTMTSITFRCWYIPVEMQLEPRESINNMGNLRVEVVSGNSLCAADRGNKSDPYAKFYMTTQKEHIYKTETIKKTLNPTWNEVFNQPVSNRIDEVLRIEVYDWDALDTDDFLGSAEVPLANLLPMTMQHIEAALDGPKGGSGQSGIVSLNLLFRPDFVTRARRGNTTRAFTIASGVGKAPVKGVASGMRQVQKSGSFIGRGIGLGRSKSSKGDTSEITVSNDGSVLMQDGKIPYTNHRDEDADLGQMPSDTTAAHSEHTVAATINNLPHGSANEMKHESSTTRDGGTVHLRLISGSNFPNIKTILKVKDSSGHTIGKTESTKQANPVFELRAERQLSIADTLEIVMMEHSTFGTDKVLSSVTIELPDPGPAKSIKVAFENGATLTLELGVTLGDNSSLKSHRGLHISRPFRNSTSQRDK